MKFCKEKIEKIEKVWNRKLEDGDDEDDEHDATGNQDRSDDDEDSGFTPPDDIISHMLKNIGNRNPNPRLNKSNVEPNRNRDKVSEELAQAKESIGAAQVSKDDNDLINAQAAQKEFNAFAYWKVDDGLDLEELMREANMWDSPWSTTFWLVSPLRL